MVIFNSNYLREAQCTVELLAEMLISGQLCLSVPYMERVPQRYI